MPLHKTLDGADTDRSWDKGLLDEMPVDLGGIEPWEGLLEPVDLFDGGIWKCPCSPLVRTFPWHKGIDAAALVEGYPFADGFWAVVEYRTVRQGKGTRGNALVIGIPGRIRIKAMDDRGDESEPELCHGSCVRKVFDVVLHENFLLQCFFTMIQELCPASHPHGVWSAGNGLRTEYLLAVGRRVFMGLEEGARKTADKGGGEARIGRQCNQGHQEGKAGVFHGRKCTKPLIFVRLKNPEPPAQLRQGDGEAFAELLHGGKADEILRQDA